LELKEVNLRNIYRNWKSNSNVFEAFIRSGPFVSLQTYENFTLDLKIDVKSIRNKQNFVLDKIINSKKQELIICDFNFDDCVEMGFLINNEYRIKPILSFNMIFNSYGLIGNKTNIESLIKYGLSLDSVVAEKYVMFLNYERYGSFNEEDYKKRLNNQYEVCEDDLPYAETLKSLGYSKVLFLTREKVKEDVNNYLEHLIGSGIPVEIIRGEV
jgi:hypothetical protein